MGITIGCDPEVFVVDSSGSVGTAIECIGGSKMEPLRVNKGALQEDNVLAEFNTDPADSVEAFVDNVNTVLGELRNVLSFLGFKPLVKASHEYTEQELEDAGYAAFVFGCDPDFNAYTGEANPKPDPVGNLRTAGGHVHIGYDNPDEAMNRCVGMACDILLGIPSVLLDDDTRRRSMYGTAGAIRHKQYGVEYRSLSNFWLASDDLKRWVFAQAEASVHAASSLAEYHAVVDADEVQRIINTGDKAAATAVVSELGINMPEVDDDNR